MKHDTQHRERTTDLGAVRINNDVITAIASIAATEIKGVQKMGGGLGKSICDMLTKKGSARGVRIKTSDGDVRLDVSIIVDYGVDIPRIADEVQENVKLAVEKMTGLVLSEVNIVVEGVSIKARPIEKKI
jgi:uncharacterized alkaline shock family protein YloU